VVEAAHRVEADEAQPEDQQGASLREIAGSRNDELAGQIAAFSDDEKAALATFGEDLRQATTSVEAIAHKQDNIENAVSGTRQESLSKLDAITEGQELWARKLEANEAQVNAMVADIGGLQQQIAAVLEMLNTCVQGLTDVLDSNNKHELKLEDTVNQNLTTIAELISQVKANRACLEDQVQKSNHGFHNRVHHQREKAKEKGANEKESLIVASKVKAYIKSKEMMTSSDALKAISDNYVEMPEAGMMNWCCGAGGGVSTNERANEIRLKAFGRKKSQLDAIQVDGMVSACSNCRIHLEEGLEEYHMDLPVLSLTELIEKHLVKS